MQRSGNRMISIRVATITLCSLFLSFILCPRPVFAQSGLQERVNRGVVPLMAGDIDSTNLRLAADLVKILNGDDLRVLSIVSPGSIKNIEDLLYLEGIDVAMVQSDVLAYLELNSKYRSLQRKLRYVTKLYNEELHLLAGSGISTLTDLNGRQVNFGDELGGTAVTAANVFNTLKIDVKPVYFDQNAALAKLRSGEIAAIAYVVGKPTNLFLAIHDVSPGQSTGQNTGAENNGLHFLPVGHTAELLQTYLPARLSHDDYPNLIADNEYISTVAVGTLMVVYNWQGNKPRQRKVSRFVERFFDSVATLRREPGHPKWQEISLPVIVPGWRRFSAAENWLQRNDISAATESTESAANSTPTAQ